MEGFFTVKATTMGVNLCFLESCEEGALEDLGDSGRDWLHELFKEIWRWHPLDVNKERSLG